MTELTRLFQKCRTSGSVVITLKKCKFVCFEMRLLDITRTLVLRKYLLEYQPLPPPSPPFSPLYPADDGRTKPVPRKGHVESFEPADNKCLIRASDGKKKISTVVSLPM